MQKVPCSFCCQEKGSVYDFSKITDRSGNVPRNKTKKPPAYYLYCISFKYISVVVVTDFFVNSFSVPLKIRMLQLFLIVDNSDDHFL